MAKKQVFEKAVRVKETPITDKISMILFEKGTIQLRYTEGGRASCLLNDDMFQAIVTAKFRQVYDTFRVRAMDLEASKAPKQAVQGKFSKPAPVMDINAIVAQAVAAALAGMQKQA